MLPLLRSTVFTCLGLLLSANGIAQEQAFKKLPPDGIEIDAEVLQRLTDRVESINESLAAAIADSNDSLEWRSDVDVLLRAVHLAVTQNLFFKANETQAAEKLLDEAERRIAAAKEGKRGLALIGLAEEKQDEPQMLVGGFVSNIDDSVQPYGLVIPAGFDRSKLTYRLDVWLHGRGDTKTEIPFLTERMTKPGQYTPENTIVLHPFGRHCNAFKFAGETDVYESIAQVSKLVSVNPNLISIRGFSMGGAGCWHLAVHDSTRWFAANPGAGFVDTLVYQGWTETTPLPMDPVREKLLKWYDVLPWVANLQNTHVIPYSGENDKQKQAADRVNEVAETMGMVWPYVIGVGMGHKIDPESQQVIDEQLAQWAEEPIEMPRKEIDFITYTLRYSKADWLRVTGMREHWTAARVKAMITGDTSISLTTDGVTHIELDFSETGWPGKRSDIDIDIDGESYTVEDTGNLKGFQCRLVLETDGKWSQQERASDEIRKRPGLQGPIDDAFCDRFVFVLPSRPARHGRVQRWIDRETRYAQERWSRLMRGDVQVVMDSDLTEDQIATCNLICFGDLSSNRFLFSVAEALPLKWTRETLEIAGQTFDPVRHAPVMCVPNPMNPQRYLVINSGMTFREFSNVSNSRQIAMLPDWAVLDVTEKDDSIFAGAIAAQGFFDEKWNLPGSDAP
ncbi:hypothetical protein [Stieleria varia]|uniref:Prolyl oligopeptidase family protein n=1 Tax=Stieleria varia TaxID=2528005 RepID=A0A5C6AP00_9BACT|nr:hypothetical protein [Stieleria varia]TWU01151.1 hypothetical protein Pla52n_45230 [Stieleria varia]